MHHRVGREGRHTASLESARTQVGVLASRARVGFVEAADTLEQGARIRNVAGLVVRARAVDAHGLGERPQSVGFRGIRERPTPDDRVTASTGGRQKRLQPRRRGNAVVIREGDERSVGQPPAAIAGCRRPPRLVVSNGSQAELAQLELSIKDRRRPVGRRVVDDHHLEVRTRQRLGAKRGKERKEPVAPIMGRGDHGYQRGCHVVILGRPGCLRTDLAPGPSLPERTVPEACSQRGSSREGPSFVAR